MKIRELKKEIWGVFKPPVKRYYLGKLAFGTPYFYPWNFEKYILHVRILKRKSDEEYKNYCERFPHLKNQHAQAIYSNLPMVRRTKDWIFRLFGKDILLQIGWPIMMKWNSLGWKDKYGSPRFEWSPAFYIFFFKWQFCIWWASPDGNNDKYYEQILWWMNYCDKDLHKAEKSWGWIDMKTKESTWNKDYLL